MSFFLLLSQLFSVTQNVLFDFEKENTRTSLVELQREKLFLWASDMSPCVCHNGFYIHARGRRLLRQPGIGGLRGL